MPTLTKRSIIETGSDVLVITAPQAWVDYYKLETGNKVEVVVNNDHLVVRRIDQSTDGPTVKRLMKINLETLVFPIPRAWADSHGLSKGDKVEVITNGELIVRPLKAESLNGG